MIVENSKILGYTLIRSARAKNMRITIQPTGVIVTVPNSMSIIRMLIIIVNLAGGMVQIFTNYK
jgi:hypothetical protein